MKPFQYLHEVFSEKSAGEEIYRIEDAIGAIVVIARGDRRTLTLDSIYEQSSVLISKPQTLVHAYTQAMLLSLLFIKPEHVTLFGLGGGSLALCLHRAFPQLTIRAVEVRGAVIDVAYRYFYLPHSARLQVTHAEVNDYLTSAPAGSTDIILSDLYHQYGMDSLQLKHDYIKRCYDLLSAEGWLVLNYHELPTASSPVIQAIVALFVEVYQCTVPSGNWILLCGKSTMSTSRAVLTQRAKELEQLIANPLTLHFKQLMRLKVSP